MKQPFISVIITTHDRSKLLERSIRSIITQTYTENQFIVVSDVSDFNAYNVACQMMRHDDLFVQRNGLCGPAESRNTALKLAKGSHIIFLDDDDALHPDFFMELLNYNNLINSRNVLFVNVEVVDQAKGDEVLKIDFSGNNTSDLLVKNFIPNNCVIYPSEVARKIEFDQSMAYEDWDYLLKAIRSEEIIHIPIYGPIVYKNSDRNVISRGESNNNKLFQCYMKIYRDNPSLDQNVIDKRRQLFAASGLDLDQLMRDYKD